RARRDTETPRVRRREGVRRYRPEQARARTLVARREGCARPPPRAESSEGLLQADEGQTYRHRGGWPQVAWGDDPADERALASHPGHARRAWIQGPRHPR